MERSNWIGATGISLVASVLLAAFVLQAGNHNPSRTQARELAVSAVQTPSPPENSVRLPLVIRNHPPRPDLIINEVMYWPAGAEAGNEWVELYNPTSHAVNLGGWTVANGDLSGTITLPAWTMPASTYLVVHFGAGNHDPDFSDGAATFYTGLITTVFENEQDAIALYRGAPGPFTIQDFIAWSDTGEYSGGVAYEHAVGIGIWHPGTFFKSVPLDATALTRPAMPGESIGRDVLGTDTNRPEDWAPLGGTDALGTSPGAANAHDWRLDFGDEELPAAPDALPPDQPIPQATPQPQPRKSWTVMVFMDPRDPNLQRYWINDINQMERSGSDANVNVVVQIGFNPGRTYRYYITHDTSNTQIRSPQAVPPRSETVNPGDPDALNDFINWAKTNFPANRYAIVLAGHGQGWKGTMIFGNSDHLTMAELNTGLTALGGKFDVVLFYSCLMGQIEVGYQIADQASMMVASEEVTWTVFPWEQFINRLKNNAGWNAGQFADHATQDFAGSLKARARTYTMASVDLNGLKNTLSPRVDTFASKLTTDVEDYKAHDTVDDNAQIRIKKEAQEEAEDFVDSNFKDLYHFAELVKPLPLTAAGDAQPIMNALAEGTGGVIRWEDHGAGHPNAHGLSIHFPHDLVYPDRGGGITNPSAHAFDNPTFGTHLYKRDAAILLPQLRSAAHALADDSGFTFPNATHWDEFLHRYYKPVADACIRQGNACVSEVTVTLGTQLTLSGMGSSDSDGRERDDAPAHRHGPIKHWYWDFQTQSDHAAAIPNYREGTRYRRCDEEDCDRDEVDDEDDDRDAEGRTVTYVCQQAGTFRIRLMVWDEHHDQRRLHVEDRSHNQGRHWLHFNVDDDWVTVTCEEPETPPPSETPPPTEVPPPTNTPTPTPTRTPAPTATPSATPTPKRTLTGVSSIFTAETTDAGHVVNMGITALDAELDGVIYDVEILTARQDPPWESVEGLGAPVGWNWELVEGGLRFVTTGQPLRAGERADFRFRFAAADIPSFIVIHLSGSQGENLGEITSQRTENRLPFTPANPSPADGATNVPCGTTAFAWAGGDPDPGDSVTYDVYNGPGPEQMSLVVQGASATSFVAVPEWRDEYWQIIAQDSHGATTAGPIWHFQTGPWTELLDNGGFEFGAESWQQTSLSELPLIWNVADIIEFGDRHTPRGGQWFAWLGNYHDAQDHLWQTFSLPAGTRIAETGFWWLMETQEETTAAVDTLESTLTLTDGSLLTTLGTISNASSPENAWSRQASHLRFTGVNANTEVQLHFRAATNEAGLTDFHLDDVSFELCSPGGEAGYR